MGSTLYTEDMLHWTDFIYVFEAIHIKRIREHVGDQYQDKVTNLGIADEYNYFQRDLVLLLLEKVKFYLA